MQVNLTQQFTLSPEDLGAALASATPEEFAEVIRLAAIKLRTQGRYNGQLNAIAAHMVSLGGFGEIRQHFITDLNTMLNYHQIDRKKQKEEKAHEPLLHREPEHR